MPLGENRAEKKSANVSAVPKDLERWNFRETAL